MHKVYIGLGSNLGDKKRNIKKSIDFINCKIGKVLCRSSLYETEPVGFDSENEFINAACVVETTLLPMQVLEISQAIEMMMGRKSKSFNSVYSDRLIDIDILMYDDVVLESDRLVLPHPYFHKRLFVLAPLAEIAPHIMHPVLKKSIDTLNKELMKNI